jgi:hypothetical protein
MSSKNVLLVGLLWMLPGCPEEGFEPVEGGEEIGGIVFSPLDNPRVTATVNGISVVSRVALPASRYAFREVITPDVPFLRADVVGVVPDPWAWEGDLTYVPRVLLPWRTGPASLEMWVRRGRERTEPVAPGTVPPPVGFDEELIDTIRVQLDPDVLLLPVRVHLFARPQVADPIPWDNGWPVDIDANEEFFSQMLDNGSSTTVEQTTVDTGFESFSTVDSRFYADVIHAFAVDSIWTQCDIQFRFESVEVLASPEGYWQEFDSCSSFDTITEYRLGRRSEEAIDVFVGGEIGPTGCGDAAGSVFGVTTGPSNSCDRVPGTVDFHHISFDGARMWSRTNVVAHELGHFLGLGHVNTALDDDCPEVSDTAGIDGLLMETGGGTVGTAGITPAQCQVARCLAGRWLVRWGRLAAAEADALCVGL